MPKAKSLLELHRTDGRIVAGMETVEVVCVAAAVVIAAASVVARLVPALGGSSLRWTEMPLASAVAALTCSVGLALSSEEKSRPAMVARRTLGLMTALVGLAGAAQPEIVPGWMPTGLHSAQGGPQAGAITWLVAAAFVCLGMVILLAQTGKGWQGWIPDAAVVVAGWVLLTLAAGAAFGAMHTFGQDTPGLVTPALMLTLLLLTLAAVGRRVEYGFFSIFVGGGIGSRISRGILPLVLLIPISREIVRARVTRMHLLPDHYSAAMLAATGTTIALALLLAIGWQVRRLEWEIQSLSLRDELTGLYNLRGFHLLGEQALRMARRSRMPFSVLFVDVDNLKHINDVHGHAAGSQLIVEAAEFLKSSFRETDVVGRLGGDEFAVAGQFSADAIEQAEERLRADHGERAGGAGPELSLSMGHVTANLQRLESLEDLLDRADAAMYERKRMKKLQII
jgi:diguanylate cyclase (GGDEF)-like protein